MSQPPIDFFRRSVASPVLLATSLSLFFAMVLLPSTAHAHPGEHSHNPATVTSSHKPVVKIVVRDGYRYITSNGIPNHKTGQFPTQDNPNKISPQQQSFRMTITPKPATTKVNLRGHVLFGVALNGIVFDPGTAEIWRNGKLVRGGPPQAGDWRYEGIGPQGGTLGLDDNNAHVQPQGTYHYHGLPMGLIDQLKDPKEPQSKMLLIAWAADGYPVYDMWGHKEANDSDSPLVKLTSSYQLKKGDRPADAPKGQYDGTFTDDWAFDKDTGDLDENNGRTGVTPEFLKGTYYYVLTETFPFVPRQFHGTPDGTFISRPPNGGAGGAGGHGGAKASGRRAVKGDHRVVVK